MTIEDRLRRAIAARTRSVEPSDDGLRRIHEKLLDTGDDMDITPDNRWYVIAAVAAVVLALAGGGLVLAADDGDGDRTGTANEPDRTTTTTGASTTTTEAPGTTTTAPGGAGPEAPDSPPADAVPHIVWPRPSSDVRFDDPSAAASSWARFYAGFADPHLGDYRAGDGSSGEVPVFPLAGGQGAETTVNVRRFGDGHWYVIGSGTADITVTEPTFDDRLACPQALRGTALAYEGTVQARIDAYLPDGRRVEVGSTVVTGSGSPPAGPFEGRMGCTVPDGVEPYGIVHLFTGDEGEIGGNLVSVTFPIRLR
jgi:hypothetical protein